jgi:hypothetical protein
MGMLQRLRDAHPGVTITAYDGHFSRVGDDQSDIIDSIRVEGHGGGTYFDAVVSGQRKKPKPKAIEARLDRLISHFEGI